MKKTLPWNEFRQQGVFRGLKHRKKWLQHWTALMNEPLYPFPSEKKFITFNHLNKILKHFQVLDFNYNFFKSYPARWRDNAHRYLTRFLRVGTSTIKHIFEARSIKKKLQSTVSISRLWKCIYASGPPANRGGKGSW